MLEVLPEPGRDLVLRSARRRTFAPGETLLHQGSESTSLLIIGSGCVSVRLHTPTGDSVILAMMGPGEVVGEMALLMPGHIRTASVYAVDEVDAHVLTKDTFERLRGRHPEVNDFLMHILAGRVDRLSRRVAEAHHVPVDQRIARRLLEVGRLFATELLPVVIPLIQDEIAQLAGTTRPTTNQVLKRFEAAGVLRLVRARVELWDVAGLRERC